MRSQCVILFLASVCMVGCGEAPMPGSDESQQVAAVVTAINDAAGDEAAFKEMFVGGNAPEERGKYFSASIELLDVSVSGSDATAKVKISQGAAESEGKGGTKEEEVGSGEVSWTLKKEGDGWKVQDAPLP